MNKAYLSVILVALTTLSGLYYSNIEKGTEQQLFDEWKEKLGANFDGSEIVYRFNIFKNNLNKIQQHNARLNKGHEEGISQFIFLTHE
jgi:hypothetical protein